MQDRALLVLVGKRVFSIVAAAVFEKPVCYHSVTLCSALASWVFAAAVEGWAIVRSRCTDAARILVLEGLLPI
jgi:hypothetical protein